ncbi:hypothetical protein ACE1AT_12015 [Pelatocladus sp. BLCC-F211]|uniref:hypothetical protein n=1 Tax=Pelatocladus sp. BLCC-F211 TaxID=3342752 RepID=UPI0035B984C5
MKRIESNLKTWLILTILTFLTLIAVFLGLPALFLILRIPSFEIGDRALWILRWQNDASGSGIRFNLVALLIIAIIVGSLGLLLKSRGR